MDGTYHIFDDKPVLVMRDAEEGVIEAAYSFDQQTGHLVRNDALIPHLERELTDRDEITQEEFDRLTRPAGSAE